MTRLEARLNAAIEESQQIGRDTQALFERMAKLLIVAPAIGVLCIGYAENLIAVLRQHADGGN